MQTSDLMSEASQEIARLKAQIKELETKVSDYQERLVAAEEGVGQTRLVIDTLPVLIAYLDRDLRYRFNSRSYEDWVEQSAGELAGKHISELLEPKAFETVYQHLKTALSGQTVEYEALLTFKDGIQRFVAATYTPTFDEQHAVTGIVTLVSDVTARKKAEAELAARIRQQATVADLGQRALINHDLPNLLRETAELVAQTLEVDYSSVLELVPEEDVLVMRAGGGKWTSEAIGNFRVSAGTDSQSGYTLAAGVPVVSLDLRTETRFKPSPIVFEHGVTSSVSVIILGRGKPYGLLNVHSIPQRAFTVEDINFLSAVANIIGASVQRTQSETEQNHVLERERKAHVLAELAANQVGRLQGITAALSEALTQAAVAKVVVEQGVATLEAEAGVLVMFTGEASELAIIEAYGYDEAEYTRWQKFSLDSTLPITDAIRSGQANWQSSRAEAVAEYPLLADTIGEARANIPLTVDNRVIGALSLRFSTPRQFSADEKAFMLTLGRQCSQALERARLFEAESSARALAEQAQGRSAFLAEAFEVLGSSLEYEKTLQDVANLVVPKLADWCTVHIVSEDGPPEQVAIAHADPAKVRWALEFQRSMEKRYPYNPDAPAGLPNVLRTGQTELYEHITDEMLMAGAGDDQELLRILREISYSSLMIVPLVARGRVLGTIQFVATESGSHYDRRDVGLAEELARRAAIAVDNAGLYRQLQAAVQVRDEFLSVAAHELKTPITSLQGYAQLVMRQLNSGKEFDASRILRAMEVINQQSGKLARLVSQLLDISRLEAGRLELDKQPSDVVALVEGAVNNARITTNQHDLQLYAPATLTALVDPLRLEQVLTNLISNAIKYSPNGGTIAINISQPSTEMVQITVTDHGVGIAPEHRGQIFERFYRAHPDDHTAGVGLGLYISRQIVQLHGGTIEAESPPEGGTRMVVNLPSNSQ